MTPKPWWSAFLLSLSQFLREEAQRDAKPQVIRTLNDRTQPVEHKG